MTMASWKAWSVGHWAWGLGTTQALATQQIPLNCFLWLPEAEQSPCACALEVLQRDLVRTQLVTVQVERKGQQPDQSSTSR